MIAPYALIALLSLSAPLAAQPSAASQGKASSEDACELSLDSADLPQLLQGSFEGNAGEWVEYAPVVKGVPDTTSVMRLSIIQDPETQATGFELWFDKLGEFAVRSRVSPQGELIQELKQGNRAFLVPPAEEKKRTKSSCRIENIIKKELQSSVRESKKPVRLKTLAGEFDCQEISVKSFRGDLKVFVSEQAPLMKIVHLVLWNGSALEIVAHGKNAYSAFSKDLTILPMSKLTEMMGALQQGMERAEEQAALPGNGAVGKAEEKNLLPPAGTQAAAGQSAPKDPPPAADGSAQGQTAPAPVSTSAVERAAAPSQE